MIKKKLLGLFGKSKSTGDVSIDDEYTVEEAEETESESTDNTGGKLLAEYRETLHTSSSKRSPQKKKSSSEIVHWRDVEGIEEKIDTLHISKAEKPVSEVDRAVDRLIKKKKRNKK
ncbi:MAG: hypothetical protein FE039_03120 [Thermoplasmata archaeon]|nr:MAG: hypothetical protein FE039_03120 [Thermoplasmata archaeon]RLF52357.1 MAG: hypothetical protein DRN24_03370 [Thermoplasmata archaeon]